MIIYYKHHKHKEDMNVIDLFCGCGGMTHGLTEAGLNVVAGIDIWDIAIQSYSANCQHTAVCADLTQLSPEDFDKQYNISQNDIDIVVGSPPCQSFSMAGRRKPNDPRNLLYMEYVKYIDYFQPKALLMENVIGMLSMKNESGKKVIDVIMQYLSVNYNCIICKVYASDFEVPQNRRRVIIIGIRKDLNIIPQHPEIVSVERFAVKTVLEAKDNIPANHYLSQKAINGIKNKKEKSKQKGNGFGAQFLDIDKPSYTIPARYWKDGYDALVKYDENTIRRLTILELKRIQSFPDDYKLIGTKQDIITQIGNAVPCRLAYHLGRYLINTLQQ